MDLFETMRQEAVMSVVAEMENGMDNALELLDSYVDSGTLSERQAKAIKKMLAEVYGG